MFQQAFGPLFREGPGDLLSEAFVGGGAGPYRGRTGEHVAHFSLRSIEAKDREVDYWVARHKLWLDR